MNPTDTFVPYRGYRYGQSEMFQRSQEFYRHADRRRSVRAFSDKAVPLEVIENIIMTASTAPSGAHKQPWTFCVVSNPDLKRKIRQAAEHEERLNYEQRMSEAWKADLFPLGTDARKPFLEIAPYLIVLFKRVYEMEADEKKKNYYVSESVGIAAGFLLLAIHHAGLAALTHTPSPMNFLQELLQRPNNERPYLLIPVGYPADGAQVPNLARKGLQEVMVHYD